MAEDKGKKGQDLSPNGVAPQDGGQAPKKHSTARKVFFVVAVVVIIAAFFAFGAWAFTVDSDEADGLMPPEAASSISSSSSAADNS